jgi:hypothetical protein
MEMVMKEVTHMGTNQTPERNPGGQPTKYRPEYCQELIDYMSEGKSFEAFAGRVSVARCTLYEWVKVYPEFKEAKDIAFSKCLEKWEEIGADGMYRGGKDNPFQASIWIFQMKNRFGWRDKVEQEVAVKEPVKFEIIERK